MKLLNTTPAVYTESTAKRMAAVLTESDLDGWVYKAEKAEGGYAVNAYENGEFVASWSMG